MKNFLITTIYFLPILVYPQCTAPQQNVNLPYTNYSHNLSIQNLNGSGELINYGTSCYSGHVNGNVKVVNYGILILSGGIYVNGTICNFGEMRVQGNSLNTNSGGNIFNCGTLVSSGGGKVIVSGSGTYSENCTSCGINSLPIKLQSFSVDCGVLAWITESEINNNYFTVETSLDLITWSHLVDIVGAGNSNELKTYTLLSNVNVKYYRLSQTDFDGKREYFTPISDDCKKGGILEAIYDLNGKNLGTDKSTLKSGIYVFVLENGKKYLNVIL